MPAMSMSSRHSASSDMVLLAAGDTSTCAMAIGERGGAGHVCACVPVDPVTNDYSQNTKIISRTIP